MQFYDKHMKDWPELALVAEHVDRHNVSDEEELAGLSRPIDSALCRAVAVSRAYHWLGDANS